MKTSRIWRCSSCGKSEPKWVGVCSVCQEWNTFFEESVAGKKQSVKQGKLPTLLSAIQPQDISRHLSGLSEFDRLMGGGTVPGALTLIGGAPGIGKSTLLLQVAHLYAAKGHKVLYVSAEESEEQVSLRAHRLQLSSGHLYVLSETGYGAIFQAVSSLNPSFLFIDSVQILHSEEISAPPGSMVQVKELAVRFMDLSKKRNISTFLIGHVTKTGDLAGPRVLEHLVDTVLEFEGDKQSGFRLLRSIKNRFGSTDDLAIFQMEERGLQQVLNPSKLFLEERASNAFGVAVTASMEGARAFLLEIQALVTRSFLPTPCRKSTGIDQNRLSLLLAVLQKHLRYKIHESDVFVSLTGGMKVKEPAIDLAIVCAISSSLLQTPLKTNTLVLGEVGLSGEIKACPRIAIRLKEGKHLGFQRAIIPKKNFAHLPKNASFNMELIGVDTAQKAIALMGN